MPNTETHGGEIVLVVDDAPDSLGLLAETLEQVGFTVLVATDGRRALELTERITPDAILLDACMPGLDGFETSRALKRQPSLADVPILFLTGLSDTEHVIEGLEAGGVDYISKPIDPFEMIARLRVHIGNARARTRAVNALDVSGRHLLAVDRDGAVLWASVEARVLLDAGAEHDATEGEFTRLPAPIGDWLERQVGQFDIGERSSSAISIQVTLGSRSVRVAYLGRIRHSEYLLRVDQSVDDTPECILRQGFSLTEREAEVLRLVASGKPNKRIALMLDMSPRTVNKHLDRIFMKLGVDNRTSAAIVALRHIMRVSPSVVNDSALNWERDDERLWD